MAAARLRAYEGVAGSLMSYSTHRKNALDETLALEHRIAHLRSCASRVASKVGLPRKLLMDRIAAETGLALEPTGATIARWVEALERTRKV